MVHYLSTFSKSFNEFIVSHGDWRDWSPAAVNEVYRAVTTTGLRLSLYEGQTASYVQRGDPASAFRTAMGPVEIFLSNEREGILWSAETFAVVDNGTHRNRIDVYSRALANQLNQQEADWFEYNLVHEFGHVLNNRLRGTAVDFMVRQPPVVDPSLGWEIGPIEGEHPLFRPQRQENGMGEIWADQFLFWVYSAFDVDLYGQERQEWMDDHLGIFMNAAARRDISATQILDVPQITGHVQTSGENLNLRIRAGINATTETSIPINAAVEVLGRDNTGEWIAVAYGSSIGWVSAEYLQVDTPYLSEISQARLDYASGRVLVDSMR